MNTLILASDSRLRLFENNGFSSATDSLGRGKIMKRGLASCRNLLTSRARLYGAIE